jgi:hypothetical protein
MHVKVPVLLTAAPQDPPGIRDVHYRCTDAGKRAIKCTSLWLNCFSHVGESHCLRDRILIH